MKEQIKQIIDSYGMFHNPKKLEECAEEVAALETQTLKEQMERVIGVIDNKIRLLRQERLSSYDSNEMREIEASIYAVENLKSQLESE